MDCRYVKSTDTVNHGLLQSGKFCIVPYNSRTGITLHSEHPYTIILMAMLNICGDYHHNIKMPYDVKVQNRQENQKHPLKFEWNTESHVGRPYLVQYLNARAWYMTFISTVRSAWFVLSSHLSERQNHTSCEHGDATTFHKRITVDDVLVRAMCPGSEAIFSSFTLYVLLLVALNIHDLRPHIPFLVYFFLSFIYFTSFREQDKVDINALRWSAPVELESAYTPPVSRPLYHCTVYGRRYVFFTWSGAGLVSLCLAAISDIFFLLLFGCEVHLGRYDH